MKILAFVVLALALACVGCKQTIVVAPPHKPCQCDPCKCCDGCCGKGAKPPCCEGK